MATTSNSDPPLFLLSRPRDDWALRGRANVFAEHAASPDAKAAQRDWDTVAAAIVEAGGRVVVIDNADPLLTGLPYTAEAGFLGRDAEGPLFVLPRLTPPHRQGEVDVVAAAVTALGLRTRRTTAPFEGQGDIIRLGHHGFVCTFGVGRWARTTREGHAEVEPFLPAPSICLAFHADPWFHGNTFVGAFDNACAGGTDVVVVACEEAFVDDGFARLCAFADGARIVTVTAAQTLSYATNALQVRDTVLAPAGVPDVVVDAWRGLGLHVRFLELPALFQKGGGAAVCLTNRLDVPAGFVVDDSRLWHPTTRPTR